MTRISASAGRSNRFAANSLASFKTSNREAERKMQLTAGGTPRSVPSARERPHRDRLERSQPAKTDRIWAAVRHEAQAVADSNHAMAPFIFSTVLDQCRLEDAIATRIAQRLATPEIGVDAIFNGFCDALADEPLIGNAMRADLAAVRERDPACDRYVEPLLYFKGYHALQAHRLAHWLWKRRHRDFAMWLQSRSSEVFQTDINPAARIGRGILLDHATGLVIGATAVVDDDVSLLHEVTLGGTGKEAGDRHPKIKRGVLIGAGAKILGNITVGASAKVAAGSVVLHAVPANATVAGVPARVVGKAGHTVPAHTMDQMLLDEA